MNEYNPEYNPRRFEATSDQWKEAMRLGYEFRDALSTFVSTAQRDIPENDQDVRAEEARRMVRKMRVAHQQIKDILKELTKRE